MVVPVDQADRVDRRCCLACPSSFCRFARNQRGVTNIEYALVVALISAVLVAASNNLGANLQSAPNGAASFVN